VQLTFAPYPRNTDRFTARRDLLSSGITVLAALNPNIFDAKLANLGKVKRNSGSTL